MPSPLLTNSTINPLTTYPTGPIWTLFSQRHCSRGQGQDMANDKTTQTTPPGSPRPYTMTQVATSPPGSVTPRPSRAVTRRGPRSESTSPTGQNTNCYATAPQSLPQFIRSIWTDQEVNQLVQLRSQGLPWSQVSTHFLGKTANACRKRHERHMKRILQQGQWLKGVIYGTMVRLTNQRE